MPLEWTCPLNGLVLGCFSFPYGTVLRWGSSPSQDGLNRFAFGMVLITCRWGEWAFPLLPIPQLFLGCWHPLVTTPSQRGLKKKKKAQPFLALIFQNSQSSPGGASAQASMTPDVPVSCATRPSSMGAGFQPRAIPQVAEGVPSLHALTGLLSSLPKVLSENNWPLKFTAGWSAQTSLSAWSSAEWPLLLTPTRASVPGWCCNQALAFCPG